MSAAPDLDIDHIAKLARLDLTDAEKSEYRVQIGHILGHIAKLNEVNVDGVEAMAHAFPLDNVWREDRAQPGLPVEDALRNAPARRDNLIAVPPVVE